MDRVHVRLREIRDGEWEGFSEQYPGLVAYGRDLTGVVLEMETLIARFRESRGITRRFMVES